MLERPSPSGMLTQWTPQPVAIVVAVLLVAAYAVGLRRLGGRPWPAWRTSLFGLGVVLLVWAGCGFLQVYSDSLYWVWTSQTLILWLVVPILILSGHPVQLARATASGAGRRRIDRVLRSRACRVIANPLVGPALVPLLSFVLFFGPLPEWTVRSTAVDWLVQLGVLLVGALMVLPLAGLDEDASSLAVGLSLAIGSFELVIDALPGIILRLRNGLATDWFHHRDLHAWTPDALHDQRVAGAILWCIAEILDLPFLFLVFRRWLRADARDAARVDAVLDAERTARRALTEEPPTRDDDADGAAAPEVERDAPWWLSDPAMQRRMRGQRD